MKIYLASKSPRRQSLLGQIGIDFDCVSSEIDESPQFNENPIDYVQRMAREKAINGWQNADRIINIPLLAADTSVVIGDDILGKPVDSAQAFEMLMRLSEKTHQVMTAVAVKNESLIKLVTSITYVTFDSLTEQQINDYIETKDCFDKAGSYGIQGYAARFITSISGSYSGVVGLPLYETAKLLEEFD